MINEPVRRRVWYFGIALNVTVLAAMLILIPYVRDTNRDQETLGGNLQIGCERANRTRDALRWNTEMEVERALLEGRAADFREGTKRLTGLQLTPREKPQPGRPWLVDCEAAYP